MRPAKRILVYEDDEASNGALSKVLRVAGYSVESATHFAEALGIIERDPPPELLVSDIVFPAGQVSGLAMARMARIKRPNMRVIYVTGFDISHAEREALGPILQKPISEEELIAVIERVLASE